MNVKVGHFNCIFKKLYNIIFEKKYRKLLGEALDASSIEELLQLENQLERSLTKIRAKKVTYISLIIYFDR